MKWMRCASASTEAKDHARETAMGELTKVVVLKLKVVNFLQSLLLKFGIEDSEYYWLLSR